MSAPAAVVPPVYTGTMYCQSSDFRKDSPDGPAANATPPRGNVFFINGQLVQNAAGSSTGRYALEVTLNGVAGAFPVAFVSGKNYLITITEA